MKKLLARNEQPRRYTGSSVDIPKTDTSSSKGSKDSKGSSSSKRSSLSSPKESSGSSSVYTGSSSGSSGGRKHSSMVKAGHIWDAKAGKFRPIKHQAEYEAGDSTDEVIMPTISSPTKPPKQPPTPPTPPTISPPTKNNAGGRSADSMPEQPPKRQSTYGSHNGFSEVPLRTPPRTPKTSTPKTGDASAAKQTDAEAH